MEWQKNIILAPLTTFQIGGPADYFYEAESEKDILRALREAKKKFLPIFILGGGSNILFSDRGFRGLVLKINNKFINFKKIGDKTTLETGAGLPLAVLVAETLKNNLSGLEWAIGIPGTVGGAVVGNSGAYGHSFCENIKEVKFLNEKDRKINNYSNEDCQFCYRGSRFKKEKGIVLSVVIELKKSEAMNSQLLIKTYLEQRKAKIPPYPSAGSVFKNIEISKKTEKILRKIPKNMIKSNKVAAGYLIEQCRLKGKRIGGAAVSEQHANFIVNIKDAKAEDVLQLMQLCQKSVKEKFGIELKSEIRLVGF